MHVEAAEMPNEVLAILDDEESRAAAPGALKLRDSVLGKGDLLVATGRTRRAAGEGQRRQAGGGCGILKGGDLPGLLSR